MKKAAPTNRYKLFAEKPAASIPPNRRYGSYWKACEATPAMLLLRLGQKTLPKSDGE